MQLNDSWRLFPHTYAEYCSGKTWRPYPYLRYISVKLAHIIAKGGGRVILNLPPRHGKSEFISKWLCSWFLDTYVNKNIILTCYGDELASSFGRAVRNHLQENQHTRAKVKPDSSAANRFDTTFGGTMITAGIGGAITGRGGHLLVCDDPYKNWEEAASENYRQKVKDWWDTTFKTRQEPGATIILLMTRWHHDDLASTLEKDEKEKWDVINFPAIAETNDELGRSPGDALCPARYNEEDLRIIQNGLPDQHWQSLYQQRPSSLDGDIFKAEWWQYYDVAPNNFVQIVQFWDTAQKPGITNDWSVCATYGFTTNEAYLLDLWRKKVAAPDLEDAIKLNYNSWKPSQVVIEDKSSGASAIQYIQKFTQIPVLPVTPTKDKVLRAIESTPYLRAKKLFVPKSAPWLKEFLKEHNEFPNAAHDDQVDTTSMMVNHVNSISSYQPRVRQL